MYRLLIVDDEHVIREGLRMLPWKENQIEVVGIMKNGVEAAEWINGHEVDILLTDIRMPGMSGIELSKMMLELYPHAKAILLTGYAEFKYAKEAISLGICGYILKPSTPDEIINTMKMACEKFEYENSQLTKIQQMETEIQDYSMLVKPSEKLMDEEDDRIGQIIHYIYDHYDKELSLSVLAEQFHFTTVYLSHYIKRETGCTFLEILTSIRMYYAAKYLKESKLRNGEICQRIGMADERYFGQVFKKRYGMTPYEYRKDGEAAMSPFQKFMESENQ